MAVSKARVIVAAVMCVLVMTSLHVEVEGAITCGQVTGLLGQCLGYLRGTGGTVPPGCCTGVKKLNGLAQSTPDRQQACGCLKTISAGLKGINYGLAAALPGKCGVNIPYKISPSTDCSKVK